MCVCYAVFGLIVDRSYQTTFLYKLLCQIMDGLFLIGMRASLVNRKMVTSSPGLTNLVVIISPSKILSAKWILSRLDLVTELSECIVDLRPLTSKVWPSRWPLGEKKGRVIDGEVWRERGGERERKRERERESEREREREEKKIEGFVDEWTR